MMSGSAIAHLGLALSSLLCLCFLGELSLLMLVTYLLHLASGILGFSYYYFPSCKRNNLRSAYLRIWYWSTALALPLFTAAVYHQRKYNIYLVLLHIIYPFACLYFKIRRIENIYALPTRVIGIYLMSCAYVNYMESVRFGLNTSISFFISFFVVGEIDSAVPVRDAFAYSLVFVNAFSWIAWQELQGVIDLQF